MRGPFCVAQVGSGFVGVSERTVVIDRSCTLADVRDFDLVQGLTVAAHAMLKLVGIRVHALDLSTEPPWSRSRKRLTPPRAVETRSYSHSLGTKGRAFPPSASITGLKRNPGSGNPRGARCFPVLRPLVDQRPR